MSNQFRCKCGESRSEEEYTDWHMKTFGHTIVRFSDRQFPSEEEYEPETPPENEF